MATKKQKSWYYPGLMVRKTLGGRVEFSFQTAPGKSIGKVKVSPARAWDIARLLDVRDWDSPVQTGVFTSAMDAVIVKAVEAPARVGMSQRTQPLGDWEFSVALSDEARAALVSFLREG